MFVDKHIVTVFWMVNVCIRNYNMFKCCF